MKKLIISFFALFLLVSCNQVFDNVDPLEEEVEEEVIEEEREELEEEVVETESKIVVLVNTLNVRESNNTNSDVVGQVHLEEVYVVLDELVDTESRVWYKVQLGDDMGWVAGWYTADESTYNPKLRLAYLGGLDISDVFLGTSIEAMKEKIGEPDSVEYFTGSLYYSYGRLTFFSLDSELNQGDVKIISYTGDKEVFGIKIGMTIDQVVAKLGDYDIESDLTDELDDEWYGGSFVYTYQVGKRSFKLRVNQEGILEAIILE
jgi:uncharacterized protein YgiM (DUF1202 family)